MSLLDGTQAGVRPCVYASTLSNMNISETRLLITILFHLKHHWDEKKAALGFGADQIRTRVSMAIDNFHGVIMGENGFTAFSQMFLIGSFSYLQVIINDNIHKSLNEFEIRSDQTMDYRVSCP